jgi:hypothetical protein
MKELQGRAAAPVSADRGRVLDLLADLEAYPSWYPDVVRSVAVIERDGDGQPSRARAQLHAAVGPVTRDFDLVLAVTRSADSVRLSRVPHKPTDPERFEVTWTVGSGSGAGAGAGELRLALDANLDVPRLVPLGGVGDAMARGFVSAAVRRLEQG